MELVNKVLNILAPPFTIFFLFLYAPVSQLSKFLFTILRSFFFTEDVAGKVVIITGAAFGIGEQLAYEYARRRASLVLADIRGKRLNEVADYCLEIGSPDAVTVTADVSDVNDCKRIVACAISHFGRLDHLVSNAGIASFGTVEGYEDITQARSVMDVNFWGCVYITRFAIPHLRTTGGRIIAMSSIASIIPAPRLSFYNASKAAVKAFYETLRIEVGSEIHVTIVTPGFIESEMTKGKVLAQDGQMTVDRRVAKLLKGIPKGKADRCAKAIVSSACRSERCLTEPAWCRAVCWLQMLCPELLETAVRALFPQLILYP